MGETISLIADFCGISGFFISIFAVSKVIKLSKTIGDKNNQFAIGEQNNQTINKGVSE